ncbi:MAG: TetR/AcrR family transcriptional regulator [Sphingopyxis sp.]|uniref:TetR/AcrR family transcriptional regulator n=1 Tax=Sphingobium sp. TaxID=1912891 RepID=UPI001A222E3B|nr:TetR/AcrR family transcriptional regulator [Sphingobium sp.]MBJ7440215.1 TetR/AcrR family transcriptional regulator [Sphingopyxis sp.]
MAVRPRLTESAKPSQSLLGKLDIARTAGEKPDRRVNRTRLALLEAAQRLFALRSVEGVSIDDIAKEAEVAKGSLYNHFESKEALADELFRMMRSHVADLLDAAIDTITLPPERLVRGSFVILRFALDHPESAAALLKLSPELLDDAAPLNVKAREVIIDGLGSGHFKGIPADSATLLVVGATLVMVQDSIDRQKSVKRLIAKMIPLMAGVLRALGVDGTGAAAAAKAAARATLE